MSGRDGRSNATHPTGAKFTDSYIETALWCSTNDSTSSGGGPLDKKYSGKDLDPSTLQQIIETCRSFNREHAEILADAVCCPNYDYGCAEHDSWMTRNDHDVGYWSRDTLRDMGTGVRLSKAVLSCGETAIYVGDDGKLYTSESGSEWKLKDRRFVRVAIDEMEHFDFIPEGKQQVWCNQCEMLSINGVPCHESACPNVYKVWR